MSVATRWANWEAAGRPAGALAGPLGTITFPITPLAGRVEIALGANPAADPSTWSWLDITQWVRFADGISISRGRPDEASTVDASHAQLTLDNRDGRFARRNPYGPYFGLLSKNTPIRIGIDPGDGVHYRYHGFVNEWPTRWTDQSGNDSTVSITCAGVLRRLGLGAAIRSAMFTTFSGVTAGDFVPLVYHPCEEGSGASTIASGLVGGANASVSGNVSLGSFSGIAGSDPLPVINAGGRITVGVPAYTAAPAWQIQLAFYAPTDPAANADYLDIESQPGSGSTIAKIRLSYTNPGQLTISTFDSSGTLINSTSTGITFAHAYVVAVTQAVIGGSLATILTLYDANGAVSQVTLVTPGGALGRVTGYSAYAGSTNAGWSAGHLGFYNADVVTSPNIGPNAASLNGNAGEQAHTRMIRLCREQGVQFTCTSATSALMGAQTSGTLLDNLRACEAADMGVLYEHEFGLGYQSLDDRLNAPVQFALDFNAGHIAATPEPADDDQRLANTFTATRSGGTDATEQDDASVAEAGIFQGSGSFSLYTDDQPRDVARWKVHLGTVDEDRWPAIPISLTGTPGLIPAWTSLAYGARMTVAHPPGEVAPDTVDAVVEGWTETIHPDEWEASLNTTPASPYRVGKIADETGDMDPFLGWLESDSCVLAADVDASALSWQITADPLWTTNSDDFPVDVRIGGEVVTVSACSGASAPQTWTIQARAVNGVILAHRAGEAIELVHPIILVP